MFKSLLLQNVLSHTNTELNFHHNVNMIIGPSDHGKSAIFNGFYKILTNRPTGDEWRTWDTKKSLIELELENHTIRYLKRNNAATYSLFNKEKDTSIEFKAFGQKVPEEIQKILKINEKINIQKQLERGVPIFLIAETPGEVAKHFNSIAGFDQISKTISMAKTDIKEVETKLEKLKTLKKSKETELKKYDKILSFKKLILIAEKVENKLKSKKEKQINIEGLLNQIAVMNIQLRKKEKKLVLNNFIKKAFLLYNKNKQDKLKYQKIETIIQQIEKIKSKLKLLTQKRKIQGLVDRAIVFQKIIKDKQRKYLKIDDKLKTLKEKEKQLQEKKKMRREKEKEFKKLMPNICPLCNSILK